MSSLNLCQFIGNVGKIETRYAPGGDAICNVSLAVNESWKDKATGEKKEKTEWVRIVFFGKVAEIAEKYVKVGHPIYVSGKLSTRKWQNREGVDQYTTEIRADELKMLKQGRESDESQAPAGKSQSRSSGGQPSGGFDDDMPPF